MKNYSLNLKGAQVLDLKIINSIEAILYGAARPITLSELRVILESDGMSIELSEIKQSINILEDRYKDTSIEIKDVASGYRIQIKKEHSSKIGHLWSDKTPRISKALMETISIIAYKQPVTRGDIENIRGVTVSTRSIRTLLERNWIKVSGYRDVPGRPALYVTTKNFLDDLDMKNLSDLPQLPNIGEIEDKEVISEAI